MEYKANNTQVICTSRIVYYAELYKGWSVVVVALLNN